MVSTAESQLTKIRTVTYYVPIALAVLALLLLRSAARSRCGGAGGWLRSAASASAHPRTVRRYDTTGRHAAYLRPRSVDTRGGRGRFS